MKGASLRVAVGLIALLCGASGVRGEAGESSIEPAAQWALENPDLYDVEVVGERVVAVGYWGSVFLSEDGGERFERASTPVSATLFGVSFADEQHGWAVGERGTLLRTTDGGRSWTQQFAEYEDEFGDRSQVDTGIFAVSAVSRDEAWAVGDLGWVLHTADGANWQVRALPEDVYGDGEISDRLLNSVFFSSRERGYIAGEFGTLLRTADGGQTWEPRNDLGGAPAALYLFALSASGESAPRQSAPGQDTTPGRGDESGIGAVAGERVAAVGLEGTALVSPDGGGRWQVQLLDTRASLYGVAWSGARAFAVGDAGTLFVTRDGGASWSAAEVPRVPGWLAGADWGPGGRSAYAAGAGGALLRSLDRGQSWERVALPGDPQRSAGESGGAGVPSAPGAGE